jgi:hypothetical protein
MKYIFSVVLTSVLSTQYLLASTTNPLKTLADKIGDVASTYIIPLMVSCAVALFFWGIVTSIYKTGSDPKAVTNGRKLLIGGIIALFVIISLWGIVAFVAQTLEIQGTGVIDLS